MSKKIKLKDLFIKHGKEVKTAVENLSKTISLYLDDNGKEARDMAYEVHLAESRADKIRREIIEKIKKSRIIPADQDDLINYVAKQDKIADRAEAASDFLITQHPDLPDYACQYLCDIMDITIRMTDPLANAIKYFFEDFSLMHKSIKEINKLEEEVDDIDMKLTKKLFKDKDISLEKKIHAGKFIYHVTVVSDIFENAGDMLDPMAAKKKI